MSVLKAYETLGLEPDATSDDVERAYRRLMKRHHPDMGGRTEIAAEVNDAYATVRGWLASRPAVVSSTPPEPEIAAPPIRQKRPRLLHVVLFSAVALASMRVDFVLAKAVLLPGLVFATPKRRERLRRDAQARFEDFWWERYGNMWDAYAPLPMKGRRGFLDIPRGGLFNSLRF